MSTVKGMATITIIQLLFSRESDGYDKREQVDIPLASTSIYTHTRLDISVNNSATWPYVGPWDLHQAAVSVSFFISRDIAIAKLYLKVR